MAQHYQNPNIGQRPRHQSNASLEPHPPYNHRPDLSPTNQQGSKAQLSRGYGSYPGGSPNHPSAQLYPAHLQSLAPGSYPASSQPPRNQIDQRWAHQPHYSPVDRMATLPNPPPSQNFMPQRQGYASHQATMPVSHGQYVSPQEASMSTQYPGYDAPPPFDYIPPNVPQSFLPSAEAQMSSSRQRPASVPPPSHLAPESLVYQPQPRMYSPEPSNQLDLPPQEPGSAVSDTDEAELALALALSEKMVAMEQEREDQLRRQEEEEFERALAQSMLETNNYDGGLHLDLIPEDDQVATSSKVKLDSPIWENGGGTSNMAESAGGSSTSGQAFEFGRHDKSRIPGLGGGSSSADIAVASSVVAGKQRALPIDNDTAPPYPQESNGTLSEKQPEIPPEASPAELADVQPILAQEEPEKVFRDQDIAPANFTYNNGERTGPPPPLHILRGSVDSLGGSFSSQADRSASSWSEAGISNMSSTSTVSLSVVTGEIRSESPSELAYFNDEEEEPSTPHIIQSPPPRFADSVPTSLRPAVPAPPEDSIRAPSPYTPMDSAISSSSSNFMNHSFSPSSNTLVAPSPASSSQISPQNSYNPSPMDNHSGQLALDRVSSNTSLAQSFQSMEAPIIKPPALPPGAAPAVPLVMSSNQYIDPELLMGVTIDFKPPVLSPQLKPMSGPVPNIVSLPYGRAHPLHIQAPSWKHMMKLLTRMGNTRFEPTENAKKVIQGDAKLRTVIQFIRVHPLGNDWRTILWFTLDHPVPAKLPNAHKYLNPHPNLFPWSYALMDLPVLLRDQNAVDSDMSKTYTIPATDSLPYPTLPLTFPNLAVYLQAALTFSRQHKDDNSGYKKLAKMVQMCYPNTEEPSDEPTEKKTVGGLFKKVIGKRKKTGKTNNEEVYEYITPFVPDEWG